MIIDFFIALRRFLRRFQQTIDVRTKRDTTRRAMSRPQSYDWFGPYVALPGLDVVVEKVVVLPVLLPDP